MRRFLSLVLPLLLAAPAAGQQFRIVPCPTCPGGYAAIPIGPGGSGGGRVSSGVASQFASQQQDFGFGRQYQGFQSSPGQFGGGFGQPPFGGGGGFPAVGEQCNPGPGSPYGYTGAGVPVAYGNHGGFSGREWAYQPPMTLPAYCPPPRWRQSLDLDLDLRGRDLDFRTRVRFNFNFNPPPARRPEETTFCGRPGGPGRRQQ
jgi:hypothetical protein